MNESLLSLLGLMRRAGKLSMGFDAAAESIRTGKSWLILTTADISHKTLKELNYIINTQIEVIALNGDALELQCAIGKAVKIISINDKGFAQKAKLLMEKDYGEE